MAMKKFEYLDDTGYISDSALDFQTYLDNRGLQGWELVHMMVMEESLISDQIKYRFIWKRELE